jgi:hypothetical protein
MASGIDEYLSLLYLETSCDLLIDIDSGAEWVVKQMPLVINLNWWTGRGEGAFNVI